MKSLMTIGALLFVFSSDAVCTPRDDAVDLAAEYLLLDWTAGADGYYEGDLIFEQGEDYTGMAYWFHPDAWDTIPLFEYKMLNNYKPREEAGIDCSGFVSRCWDLSSRKVTGDFFNSNLALPLDREYATQGDVLLRDSPTGHIMLIVNITGTENNDEVTIVEAYGSPIHKVRERTKTWTEWESPSQDYYLYGYIDWLDVGVPDPCMTWSPDASPLNSAVSGNGQVTLYWDYAPGHNDDTMYKVFWGTSPGNYTQNSGQIDAYGYEVTGLTPYTTYYFAVKVGLDGYGWSDYSNELSAAPYAAPWIISGTVNLAENRSIHGDIVIQNGATLNVGSSKVLTFDNSQEGTNYGGRSTECEIVIQSGGTLNLGSSATLTSSGDWGGVYMLDGGDIDLTSGSTISNAIIGIHAFGAENINSPSQNANINNCSTGIRLSDSPANIQNIHFSGCSNAVDAIGIPVTSYIGSITIANGVIGLNSIAYAIPRLQLSEISNNMSSYAICLTQSGNLDIYQEANNIRYNGSTNTIYVSSSSPNISVEYNYWGSFPPPAAATLFNNTAKINNVQYFADYALDEPVPGAGKRAIQEQQAITDLFQQAKLYEKDFDYASAAEIYKEIHSRSTDIDSRTKSLRLMYGSLLQGGLPVNELKTSITAEIPATTGKNAMILRYLLGDILLKEGRHQESIEHYLAFRDIYKGTSAEVDALVKLAIIFGNSLEDKEQAQEYADLARNLNPGHASLPDAYSSAGIEYTALASENKYLDFNDDFDALKPAEPLEQATEAPELKVSVAPNPANPVTTLYYSITTDERVKLDIYSMSGQKITTLVDGVMSAGSHNIQFDGSSYSSGMYFYMIQAGHATKTGKFLILK